MMNHNRREDKINPMEKFREVTLASEMKAIMSKEMKDAEVGILWQTFKSDRKIYPLMALQVNEDEVTFITHHAFNIDQTHPIFIKVHNRNFIFKLTLGEYRVSLDQLTCKYPKEAKALEERTQPRTKIPGNINVFITLRTVSLGSMTEAKVQLLDISENGLGVLIEKGSEDFFINARHWKETKFLFQIVKVGSKSHFEKAQLELRHVSSQKLPKKGFKAGFHLNIPLSDEFYAILRSEMKKTPKR